MYDMAYHEDVHTIGPGTDRIFVVPIGRRESDRRTSEVLPSRNEVADAQKL